MPGAPPASRDLVGVASAPGDVPVSLLKRDDRVLVERGEKRHRGGGARLGQRSDVDGREAVEKGERATVIAGAVNGEAALTVEVQKTGDEIYLSQVNRDAPAG